MKRIIETVEESIGLKGITGASVGEFGPWRNIPRETKEEAGRISGID